MTEPNYSDIVLSLFDQYETHDLILFGPNYPQGYHRRLSYRQDNKPFYFLGNTYTLIERYTPWSYPWCDQYSIYYHDYHLEKVKRNLFDGRCFTKTLLPIIPDNLYFEGTSITWLAFDEEAIVKLCWTYGGELDNKNPTKYADILTRVVPYSVVITGGSAPLPQEFLWPPPPIKLLDFVQTPVETFLSNQVITINSTYTPKKLEEEIFPCFEYTPTPDNPPIPTCTDPWISPCKTVLFAGTKWHIRTIIGIQSKYVAVQNQLETVSSGSGETINTSAPIPDNVKIGLTGPAFYPANNDYWGNGVGASGLRQPVHNFYIQRLNPDRTNPFKPLREKLEGIFIIFADGDIVANTPQVDYFTSTSRSGSPMSFQSCSGPGNLIAASVSSPRNIVYFGTYTTIVTNDYIWTSTKNMNNNPPEPTDWLMFTQPGIIQIFRRNDLDLANPNTREYKAMPDSIRVKEIHFALGAETWGKGIPQKMQAFGNGNDSFLLDAKTAKVVQDKAKGNQTEDVLNLPQLLSYGVQSLAAYLGVHLLRKLKRTPTLQPFEGSGIGGFSRKYDDEEITSLIEYLSIVDQEVNTKLGVFPVEAYNYADLDQNNNANRYELNSIGDSVADALSVISRISVVTERTNVSVFPTLVNTIEIAKSLGMPFAEAKVQSDLGVLTTLQYNGASTMAQALVGISQQVTQLSRGKVFDDETADLIQQRIAALGASQAIFVPNPSQGLPPFSVGPGQVIPDGGTPSYP